MLIIDKGIIIPYKRNRIKNRKIHQGNAAYSSIGNLIMTARPIQNITIKTINPKHIDFSKKKVIKQLDKKVVYLGVLTSFYGHFLLESLCRFWIFMDVHKKNLPSDLHFVFTDMMFKQTDFNFSLLQLILDIFKLDIKSFIHLQEIKQFNQVLIFEPSCFINNHINEKHKQLCNFISKNINPHSVIKTWPNRIFISREGNDFGMETRLLKIMHSMSFKIILPTIKSFQNDVLFYYNATVISGLEGSNMHNILFCKPNVKSIIFDSRNRYTENQKQCDKVSSKNIFYIDSRKFNDHKLIQYLERILKM